jgi:hypothetical protein
MSVLSWRIKNKEGRYLHFTQDEACTIIKTRLATHAHIFKGTRDMVDGICMGIKLSIGEDCEPEQIIHVQHPKDEKKMDDVRS